MNDALFVALPNGGDDLREKVSRHRLRQAASAGDVVEQVLTRV